MRILVGRPDVVETASDARRMVCTVLQSVERPGSARRARAGPRFGNARMLWTKCGTCSDEGGGPGGGRPRMAGWISWCAGVHKVGGKGGVAGGGRPRV